MSRSDNYVPVWFPEWESLSLVLPPHHQRHRDEWRVCPEADSALALYSTGSMSNTISIHWTYTYTLQLMWLTILELWYRHCVLDHHPQYLELEQELSCPNWHARLCVCVCHESILLYYYISYRHDRLFLQIMLRYIPLKNACTSIMILQYSSIAYYLFW